MKRLLPSPFVPVGSRRDGRPIYPVVGAAPNDPSADPEEPADPLASTVSQDGLDRLLAREKAQGGRAAVKKLLGDLGFDTPEALGAFIIMKREADQAALSEVEHREQAAAELEGRPASASPTRRSGSGQRSAVLCSPDWGQAGRTWRTLSCSSSGRSPISRKPTKPPSPPSPSS